MRAPEAIGTDKINKTAQGYFDFTAAAPFVFFSDLLAMQSTMMIATAGEAYLQPAIPAGRRAPKPRSSQVQSPSRLTPCVTHFAGRSALQALFPLASASRPRVLAPVCK